MVYKQGQAGVQKATVTIKLKNDPDGGNNPLPPPYRDMREISITRQIIIGERGLVCIQKETNKNNSEATVSHQ